MTTTSKFDDADLGEMFLIAEASLESGFKQVTIDSQHLVDLLVELINLRRHDCDPKHIVGTLSWTREAMRVAGHTCVNGKTPCDACEDSR